MIKMLLLWAWIALLCGRVSGRAQGKHFITAFMQNGLQKSSEDGNFKLFVTGLKDSTSVTVAVYKTKFLRDFAVQRGETVPVQLPSNVEMVGSNTFHSAVIVRASHDVTVLSLSSKPNSVATTVVYPRYLLGNTHYVVTPSGEPSKGFQEFSVVSSQDPTQVFIYVTGQVTFHGVTYGPGSKLIVSLEAYQAVQIQSHQDLSGTKVVSHKPVVVLSGHSCIWAHDNCQHVFEQLLPIRKWGKEFLVAPLPFQTNYDVAYVAACQTTHLQIRSGTHHAKHQLEDGQVIAVEVRAQKPLYISSNVGVQVLFYATGGVKEGVPYDPFLSGVPAMSDYSKSYGILGQEGFHNLGLIVAESRTCQSITLDKQPLHYAHWRVIPGTSYSWTEFFFSGHQAMHFVEHPKSTFSLLSIGVAPHNSYGSVAFAIHSLPPLSPHPIPCSGTSCGKGYVCSMTHNQPQCVPEPQTCNSIQCQEGTVCKIVEGHARCVPHPPSCHHVQCQEGSICDLAGGFPKCIPAPASCENTQCKPGTVCSLTNGWPQCVPHQPSCHKVQCEVGTECEIVHGEPKCVPVTASCGVLLCDKGTMCEVIDGHPTCVRLPPSCLHTVCEQGTVCNIVDGWPKCVPGPSCANLNCVAGTECKTVNNLPRCVPVLLSCDEVHCKQGTVCEIVNGIPVCVPIAPSCGTIHCKEGTICEITDGMPKCVPTVISCDKIQCTVGNVCEMVNEWPTCVPQPHSCENTECKMGTVCDIVNGWPMCIPDKPTSCASFVCKEEAVCEMVDGKPTCIPIPLSCDRYKCRQGTVCEIVHNWPTCVPLPSSCQKTKCAEGTVCKFIDGRPKCIPIPPTCDKLQCKVGTICETVNGWPKCVPAPHSCENVYCRQGTVCKIIQGWPQCTAIQPSCDKIHCSEGTTCKMVDGWPQCVPIPPTCDKLGCKDGTTCEIIDGWPMCVPVPASCDKIQCKEGTLCKLVDDWPTCIPIRNSCEKFTCSTGTVCEIYEGHPRCISVSPSCDKFHCKEGTVCEISSGWPKCVAHSSLSSCEKISCSAGTKCEIYEGHPRCISVSPSCDKFQCKEGTVCEISSGWPKCVAHSSLSSCEKISCSAGTKCEIYEGHPRCISISPSCDKFHCKEGTVCEISSGWPKCVARSSLSSCEKISCSTGTKCEIYEGHPRCISVSPSCDKFQCKEGTVCEISSGWPKCVPHPSLSSCEKISCSAGTKCEIYEGHPRCISVSPSCDKFHCKEGTVCEISSGWPKCVAYSSLSSCEKISCSAGTKCEIYEGHPRCISVLPSCDKFQCKEGTVCEISSGWPKCVPRMSPPACEKISCSAGTKCEIYEGHPRCISVSPSCDKFQCKEGTVCEISSGWPKCVPHHSLSSCEKISCSTGTKCEIYEGHPRCISVSPSCDKFQCKEGTVCEISSGWPKCVPHMSPPACEKISCNAGTKCEIYEGHPRCISVSPSCDKFHCKEGTICEISSGWPKCVPRMSPPACEKFSCHAGTVCEIYEGHPRCIPISPSCDKFHCKEGTLCEISSGWPKCVPRMSPPACEQFSCHAGTVCEIYEGHPRCIPISPSCDKFHCKEGTVCEISSGWPKCIPHSSSQFCGNVSCSAGNVCQMAYGWPRCVTIPPSCAQFSCSAGTVCQIISGWPTCVPIPPSCGNVSCRVGTVCQTVFGGPQCVPSPLSCAKFSCSAGTVCHMISGWPQCVPSPPSCDRFHCQDGTVCKIVDYWPRCVAVPPSCDRAHCQRGTVCEVISGLPTCVPVPSSCNKTHCTQGLVCQIAHGRPTCVPAAAPSCASVHCQVGTVCRLVNGIPQCVHSPPSCDKFRCSVGTVCQMVNAWPQCVPLPSSCQSTQCQRGTVCQVINGQPKCVPVAGQACRTVHCKRGTTCKVVNGVPKCVSVSPAQSICWASGQPHYHTFDGRSYDFQGTCTYTVVKTCQPTSVLPFFHIYTKSQKNSRFSSVSQVTISVYGSNITMVKYEYGLVRVNQVRSRLPINMHDGKLSLYHRGDQLVVETSFGLKVYYDWNYYLVVKVTPAFRSHICGLCGNYNGDPNDDFMTSLGGFATNPVEFGRSWKVEDGDSQCSHGCHGKCWRCSPELATRYRVESFCGLLTKHRGGPFRHCHALIDPKPYLNDCVIDLCAFEGYKQILCRALKTYADACQREGAVISAWRKHAGCPMSCPDYSQYMPCGSACPATCTNPDAPKQCHLPCVETCQCKAGYVLDSGKCIPKNRCGCSYHGRLYAPNEQFWGDQQCHQRCLCRAQDKKVICHESHCREMEGCHVVNGMRKCYPTYYGTCSAVGQLHYVTFDGLRYDFYGTCVYRLVEICHKRANQTQFQVLVRHERQGRNDYSATKAIEIKVYGFTVTVSHSKVLLNGLLVHLPYNIEYNKVALYRHGWDIVITTDFGLSVAFDGTNNIRLTVPGAYRGDVCGLCGNFNGRADDDMTLQHSQVLTTSPGDFGRSWKVRDIPGCIEKEKKDCADLVNFEHTQKTSKECGLLLDMHGPFRECHSKVPPQSYFKDCVFDFCSNKTNKNVVCHIISSYVAACQAYGTRVYEWRSASFCAPKCTANSHYKVCTSNCPVTCLSLFNPVVCTTRCHEGCECNEGYVLSGDQCVPISQCGCVHQSFYYKAGDSFYLNGFCKERCVCQVGGIMDCHRSSCGPNEECRVVEGVQKCHSLAPKRSGSCHVAGDPHYLTFDGATFDLQSNCTYTLASSCTHKTSLQAFSVNVENERRSKGKVSVTKAVSVTAYQNTISILREKRGIVLVNGATTYLPFRLVSDGMWAYYHGDNIVVRTDFGLFVSFDQLYHLVVRVPESYQGQTCGLCGNYNGRSNDDLFLPTGHPASSVQVFAAAWRVDIPTAVCADDCAASVCGACRESRKASYVHSSQCGILQAPYGPFSACFSTINPADFYNNCVHDLCKARGNTVILCRAIHAYVTACQAAGIKIKPWRTATFCPMKCPVNSHYDICVRACPRGCREAVSITKCSSNCAEGCQCKRGYFMAGYHCVPISQCRCFHQGTWFKVGVRVITANCREQCTCHRQGRVVCTPLPCAAGQTCVLSNAKWTCVRQEGHCTISQGHIFTTYDGVSGKVPPVGSYEISALINAKSTSWFRVVIQLQKCPTCPTPLVVAVTIYFHKLIVLVKQDSSVTVNGHPVHLPVQPSKEVSISLAQDLVTVAHRSGVRVLYSTRGDLTVAISGELANKVFRACGNFNGNGADDLRLPNGRVAHTITEVISHWRVTTAMQNARFKIHSY
ncbi:IgGFc-binding protein-like isoform X2 [Zootoca vivipara]|uniref:IgGFc-binding protein-like isoform X2 n=1 Tax=Zootoca vivipara TaxID=8524 RepID=UPI00293C010F|nr:IgGFc-binding protein-like isoform X2 [Zootoca vivipara]